MWEISALSTGDALALRPRWHACALAEGQSSYAKFSPIRFSFLPVLSTPKSSCFLLSSFLSFLHTQLNKS